MGLLCIKRWLWVVLPHQDAVKVRELISFDQKAKKIEVCSNQKNKVSSNQKNKVSFHQKNLDKLNQKAG